MKSYKLYLCLESVAQARELSTTLPVLLWIPLVHICMLQTITSSSRSLKSTTMKEINASGFIKFSILLSTGEGNEDNCYVRVAWHSLNLGHNFTFNLWFLQLSVTGIWYWWQKDIASFWKTRKRTWWTWWATFCHY